MSNKAPGKLRTGLVVAAAVIIVAGGLAAISQLLGNDKDAPGANQQPSNQAAAQLSYVALGDSVAAGVGLPDDSDSTACNRTNQSYPNQLAKLMNYKLTSVACSGATLTTGIIGPQEVNKLAITPQLQQLFAPQSNQPKPDIITMTIGANDANWVRFITSCYAGACASPAQTAAFTAQLPAIISAYQQALKSVQDHYAAAKTQPPRVFLTDYYHLYPAAAATCSDTAGVDAGEQQWVRQQITTLNDAIRRAIQPSGSFATMVSIDFTGHEACSGQPYIQGLNDKEPFHPTADGQAAIARQLRDAIK